jgi:hypothetical protein
MPHCRRLLGYFFSSYFGPFLKNNREMNPTKTYFEELALFSRVSLFGVTYIAVTPCARGMTTESRHVYWRDSLRLLSHASGSAV